MKRNGLIELVRFIIVLWIVLYHYTCRYFDYYPDDGESLSLFSMGGTIGVILFFLLSGYFSGRILSDSNAGVKSTCKFVVNKLWRLWPAYYVCVVIIFVVICFFGLPKYKVTFLQLTANISFIHPTVEYVDGSHWFVADLCMFILLTSTLYLVKNSYRRYLITVFTLFILYLYVYMCVIDSNIKNLAFTLRSLVAFLCGFLLYDILTSKNTWVQSIIMITFFLFEALKFKSVLYIVCVMILIFILKYNIDIKKSGYLGYLGALSYPLYLIHQNIGYIVIHKCNYNYGLGVLFALLASISISVFVERLLLKIPHKLV